MLGLLTTPKKSKLPRLRHAFPSNSHLEWQVLGANDRLYWEWVVGVVAISFEEHNRTMIQWPRLCLCFASEQTLQLTIDGLKHEKKQKRLSEVHQGIP